MLSYKCFGLLCSGSDYGPSLRRAEVFVGVHLLFAEIWHFLCIIARNTVGTGWPVT